MDTTNQPMTAPTPEAAPRRSEGGLRIVKGRTMRDALLVARARCQIAAAALLNAVQH